MIQLHCFSSTASMAPHILLRELGLPFERVLVDCTLITYFYPERWVHVGNDVGEAQVKAQAEIKVGVLLDQLDAELARQASLHTKPWLLGENYSAVDIYTLMLCRWTRNFTSNPARARAHLGPYLQRMLARPAVIEAFEVEELVQPWV